jgi:hypothetical protein
MTKAVPQIIGPSHFLAVFGKVMERVVYKYIYNYIIEHSLNIVFCDISKAFDRVWHKALIKKTVSTEVR